MAKRIYVGSLPHSIDENQLLTLFGEYGQVSEVKIILDRDTGQAKGFAFVEMANEAEAQKAIQNLNGSEVGGQMLVVSEAKERENSGSRSGGSRRY